jgi:hypothetical protein
MRYKLVAEVEGDVFISSPISIQKDEFEFSFIPSSDGRLISISITMSVPQERVKNFASTIEPGKGQSVASISIGGDIEIHKQLVGQLQTLESNFAFITGMAVQRIKWDNPKQEYIPDGPEDETILSVRGFSATQEYPKPRAFLQTNILQSIVIAAPMYDELKITKAFWREGMIYFNNFQYIQAFYQFYFIIEDFYAPGKSGKKPVLQEFRKSMVFKELCNNSLLELLKDARHRLNLEHLFSQFNCEVTSEGLQELLFEIRGALHHYSSQSQRPKGTPFNQKDFESIALLAMHLVTSAIGYQIANINQNAARA